MPDQFESYSLRIAEYAVGEFGVVLLVNPGGGVLLNIVRGDVGPLATGKKRPGYQARTHPHAYPGFVRYTRVKPELDSELDLRLDKVNLILYHPILAQEIRMVIGGTIGKIPHVDTGRDTFPLPGRYEFVIVKHVLDDAGTESRAAICVDARPDNLKSHPYAFPEELFYWGDGTRAN